MSDFLSHPIRSLMQMSGQVPFDARVFVEDIEYLFSVPCGDAEIEVVYADVKKGR